MEIEFLEESKSFINNNSREAISKGINKTMIGGTIFELPDYYQPTELIGVGSYGVVISAKDLRTEENVAVKKITNFTDNLRDIERVYREVKLLTRLKGEPNILQITDLFPGSGRPLKDIYVVTELMDTDLHQLLNSDQSLSDDHCQYFLFQLLNGCSILHSAAILHRDLKPGNVLLNGDCHLKICDFGLARSAAPASDWNGFLTEYVTTRWYRAPEVILSWKKYTKAIDVWSIGCIFAEMLLRRPIFLGNDYLDQLVKVTNILGTPSPEELESVKSPQAREFLEKLGTRERVPWNVLLPNANPQALDLLDRLLTFDPSKRISVEEALAHPYIQKTYTPIPLQTPNSEFSFEADEFSDPKLILKGLSKLFLFFNPNLDVSETSSMNMN